MYRWNNLTNFYPNDKAVLVISSVVWFPVEEVCVHPRHSCSSRRWISIFPECAAATLDPKPGALVVQICGSQVGLSPAACLTQQLHHKVILTLTFNACEVAACKLFYHRFFFPVWFSTRPTWPKLLTGSDSFCLSEWNGRGLQLEALQARLAPTRGTRLRTRELGAFWRKGYIKKDSMNLTCCC